MEEHKKDKEEKTEHKEEHKPVMHHRKKKLSMWKISSFVLAVIAIVFILVVSVTCIGAAWVTAEEIVRALELAK